MFLRIQTELFLKNCFVGGMDRVYEVGRIFRNEGMDPKHNPEFTTIELYQAYTDYHGMMDLVEEMMKTVAQKVCGTPDDPLSGHRDRHGSLGTHDHGRGGKEVFRRGLLCVGQRRGGIARARRSFTSRSPKMRRRAPFLLELFDALRRGKADPADVYIRLPVENSPLAKRKPSEPAFTEAL